MLKLGIYLSIAIIACTLYGVQAKSLEGEVSKIVRGTPTDNSIVSIFPLLDHIARQSKCNMAEDLAAMLNDTKEILKRIENQQADFGGRLDRMEKNQKDVQTKMETQQAALVGTLSEISTKVSWLKFRLIGSRLFYIDNGTQYTWEGAVSACRQLGGYIAAIKDQEELEAITDAIDGKRYWLGINDRASKNDYVSEASGKKAFLKWKGGEPNNEYNNERCVELLKAGMNDMPCSSKLNLICQADNNV